jgi:diadenosine tetraphosphate (Ap4A) HIT family hydrolase
MTELSDCEIADLFTTVKRLEFILDRVYGVSSTTISLQDGPDAGQTVPVCLHRLKFTYTKIFQHVHVHVLPRHADDFDGDNDRIYTELATHDKCTDDGQFRTIADMSDEASVYRRLLDDNDSYRSS